MSIPYLSLGGIFGLNLPTLGKFLFGLYFLLKKIAS